MWVASTPPSGEQRRAALVALLVVLVLGTGLAAGPFGLLDRADRAPAPLVEHSHVLERDGGTSQRLIPPPAEPAPASMAAVVTVCTRSGPAQTACPPGGIASAPPPAP